MGSGKKKGSAKTQKAEGRSIKEAAKEFVDEAEKTGTALVSEVRELFDDLAQKVASAASSAAETTVTMAEKVVIKEPAEVVRGLLDDVKDASEASMRTIGKGFDELRDRVLSSSDKGPSGKPKDKKEAKKPKAPARKKAANKKAAKKKVAKKKAVKKKTAAG